MFEEPVRLRSSEEAELRVSTRELQKFINVDLRASAIHVLDSAMIDRLDLRCEDARNRPMVGELGFAANVRELAEASSVPQDPIAPKYVNEIIS